VVPQHGSTSPHTSIVISVTDEEWPQDSCTLADLLAAL
jgi:hypothetical protein